MRDDDFEALLRLKALLETESWTEDHYDPDDESSDSIPGDCMPEMWTFFSTDGTAFRGKWINKEGGDTKPIAYEGEDHKLIVNLVPEDQRQRREYGVDYDVRSKCTIDALVQETRLALPPPSNIQALDVQKWRKETGGWRLRIEGMETHDGGNDVEFVAYTEDGHGRHIEKLLITGEVNSKGIDVLLFPKNLAG